MLRFGWLLLAFSGCVVTPDHEQIPLANLHQTTIDVFPPLANPGMIEIYFDTQSIDQPGDNPAECPTATATLQATVDGTPLTLDETGGWDAPVDGTSECHQIRFVGTFAANADSSQIVIADDSDMWTIATHSFATFDHPVVQPGPHGELVVTSALGQPITYLQLDITQGSAETFADTDPGFVGDIPITLSGSTATMRLPATTSGPVSIDVEGRTTPVLECDGPVACKLDDPLYGTVDAVIAM